MSKKHEITINCPACGKDSPFVIWDSINTMIHPEMKKAVRDLSAFRFQCPFCHQEAIVDYGTLYHQMEDKLMIYYVPNPDDVDRTCAMFSGEKTIGHVDIKKEGYVMRVVRSREELLEKLRVFDAGLDDRVIELLKLMVITFVTKDHPEAKTIREVFFQDQDGNKIGIWIDGKPTGTSPVTSGVYEHTASDFAKELQDPITDIPLIDKYWAAAFFNLNGDDRVKAYLGEKE